MYFLLLSQPNSYRKSQLLSSLKAPLSRARGRRSSRGFSFIEIVVSTAIFSLGASASLTVLANAISSTRGSIEVEENVSLGIEGIEQQRAQLLPESINATIGNYTRTTTVTGCSFVGTTLSCVGACDSGDDVCRVVVRVTDTTTNEANTITTLKLAEEL